MFNRCALKLYYVSLGPCDMGSLLPVWWKVAVDWQNSPLVEVINHPVVCRVTCISHRRQRVRCVRAVEEEEEQDVFANSREADYLMWRDECVVIERTRSLKHWCSLTRILMTRRMARYSRQFQKLTVVWRKKEKMASFSPGSSCFNVIKSHWCY